MAPKPDQFYSKKIGGYLDEHEDDEDEAFGMGKMSLGGLGGANKGLGGIGGTNKGLGGIGKSNIGTLGKSKPSLSLSGLGASTSKGFGKADDSSDKLVQIISSNNARLVESLGDIAKKNEKAIIKVVEYLEHLSNVTLHGFAKILEADKGEEGAQKSLEIIIQNLDEQVSQTENKVYVIIPGYEGGTEDIDVSELIKDKDVSVCTSISEVVKLVGQD